VDHVVPPDGPGPGNGSDPPSAAYRSFFFKTGSPEEAAYPATLRETFGDEFVDRIQRSRARLRERPRPLTDSERAVLRETLAPLLRDIETSGAILPIIQEWEIEELAAAGRSATWPECCDHPNSHPLQPRLDDENTAVWRCPRSGRVISAIGAFGSR
jgi:hypothetical protein